MTPLLDHSFTFCPLHGAIVISTNSPFEHLLAFALMFLIGALWGHLRCNNRDACKKEQTT